MKTEQIIWSASSGWTSPKNPLTEAQLVLVFGGIDVIEKSEHYPILHDLFPAANVVFTSTAGEIAGSEYLENSLVATAIYFEKTQVELLHLSSTDFQSDFDLGTEVGMHFNQPELAHLLVFAQGHSLNGDFLVSGIRNVIGNDIAITGGLAGDAGRFNRTVVSLNDRGGNSNVVAIGLVGKHLKIGFGSKDGWDLFGPIRQVTKSENNVLHTLDNELALDLYKKYLGSRAQELPGAALLFPLCILKEDGTRLVRTILSIDEEKKTMTFAGNVPEGARVQFMMANFDRIIEGAAEAAHSAKLENAENLLTIMVSCVGRKLVMQNRIDEEVEAVYETFGGKGTYCGYYSNGEICPTTDGFSALHNQTMTVTTLSEQ
jgi:hypothetical protein